MLVDPMKEAAAALTSVMTQDESASTRNRSRMQLFQEKSPPGMDEDEVLASLLALSSPPPSNNRHKRARSPVPFSLGGPDVTTRKQETATSKRRKSTAAHRLPKLHASKNVEDGGESPDVHLSPSAKRAAMLAMGKVKMEMDEDAAMGGASSSNGGTTEGGRVRSLTSPRQSLSGGGASGFMNRGMGSEALLPAKMRAKKKSKHSFGTSPLTVPLPLLGDGTADHVDSAGSLWGAQSRADRHVITIPLTPTTNYQPCLIVLYHTSHIMMHVVSYQTKHIVLYCTTCIILYQTYHTNRIISYTVSYIVSYHTKHIIQCISFHTNHIMSYHT
jgi:hypothetical protein